MSIIISCYYVNYAKSLFELMTACDIGGDNVKHFQPPHYLSQ